MPCSACIPLPWCWQWTGKYLPTVQSTHPFPEPIVLQISLDIKKKKVRRVSSLLPRWTKPYRWMKNIIFTSVLYHCQTELVICPTFLRPRAGLEDVAVKWQVGQEGNTLAATAMQQQPLPAELTAPKRRRQMSGRFNPSSWVTVPLDGRLGFVTAHIAFFLLYTAPGMDSPSTSSFHWFLRSILRIILLHCIA